MAVYKMTPTKGNLIKMKGSLKFAQMGYELLDKKRTVLVKEMMDMVETAQALQQKIEGEFERAYRSLETAAVTMGTENLEQLSLSSQPETEYEISYKSTMGVETPIVLSEQRERIPEYGMYRTNAAYDRAVIEMAQVQQLIYQLAETENSVYKLALEIKKTQKRANALEKIQIPRYEEMIKFTEDVLAEKEREDFFRLKKVKSRG